MVVFTISSIEPNTSLVGTAVKCLFTLTVLTTGTSRLLCIKDLQQNWIENQTHVQSYALKFK